MVAGSGAGGEDVVPIVEAGPKAQDGRMKADHGMGHGFTGGVGVEAAIDVESGPKELAQPTRVGTSARGREATVTRMKRKAADGIDGGFTKDDGPRVDGGQRDGKEAVIFAGARRHSMPGASGGSSQFGADGLAIGSAQQKDGVGFGIGIEGAASNEGSQEIDGQAALASEIVLNEWKICWVGQRDEKWWVG